MTSATRSARRLTNSELSDLDAGELREHAAEFLAASNGGHTARMYVTVIAQRIVGLMDGEAFGSTEELEALVEADIAADADYLRNI